MSSTSILPASDPIRMEDTVTVNAELKRIREGVKDQAQFNHALEDTDFESNYEAENEMEIEDNEDLNEGVTQEFDVGFDAAEEDLNKDVADYGSDAYYYDSTDPPSCESEEDVEREPISTHKKPGQSGHRVVYQGRKKSSGATGV
nr:hypothetical protein Iba_chr02bCG15460 [Ipomoea batatas]